jgi:hypothetical protein
MLLRYCDTCQAYMRSRNADAVSIARWIIKPVTADVSHYLHYQYIRAVLHV